MMRSLWTAASGMTAQQTNVDTISNNLANVNTTGYKKERLEFKTLLYQTMERAILDPANQTGRPVNLQVGLGVRPIATSRLFETGSFEATQNGTDIALEGPGMFVINENGNIYYTRDGSFKLSLTDEGRMLATSEGWSVLGTDGEPIYLPEEISAKELNISQEGFLTYNDPVEGTIDFGYQIAVVQFSNYQGLVAAGGNKFAATSASGQPMFEFEGGLTNSTKLVQGYLEMSNVQVAEEMVKLIVAQRAYELNSKAITTSDDMLQTANNLKR